MKKMKQIALSVVGVVFIAIGLIACSNEDDGVIYNGAEETYESISTMTTFSQKQSAFDYLTNQEKYNVWQYKYESFLNENDLTQEEEDYIIKLKSSFTPKMFDPKSNEHKVFQTIILDELFNEALQVFEARDKVFDVKGRMASFLLFELDGYVIYGDDEVGEENGGDDGVTYVCSCAIGSKYTCVSMSVEYGECGNGDCVRTNSGCGGLWASDCTGSECTY